MITINMLSHADSAKGHGVLSAYNEQVALVKKTLGKNYCIYENKKGYCDIMHIHTVNPSFLLRAIFKPKHCTTVGYVHFLPETLDKSIKLPSFARKVFYKYVIYFYKKMEHLVVVNPCFIPQLVKYGISESKVTYIPNFVSEEQFFVVSEQQKMQTKSKYNLPQDKMLVLSVGQLQKRKGVLEFIELAKQCPEKCFVWVGGFSFGKISDGYTEIKNAMKSLPQNVHFLGMVERSEMNNIYNIADVLFQPSYDELFPMTILEAMCCEKPLLLRNLKLYHAILDGYYTAGETTLDFKQKLNELQQPCEYSMAVKRSVYGKHHYSAQYVSLLWQSYYAEVLKNSQKIKNLKIHPQKLAV